jgi:hypothetical protein
MRRASELTADHSILTLANTHSDGDHWFGDQMVALPHRHDQVGKSIRPFAADFDLEGSSRPRRPARSAVIWTSTSTVATR